MPKTTHEERVDAAIAERRAALVEIGDDELEDAALAGAAFEDELSDLFAEVRIDPSLASLVDALVTFRDDTGAYPSEPVVPGGYRATVVESIDGFELVVETLLATLVVVFRPDDQSRYAPRVEASSNPALAYDLAGLVLYDLHQDSGPGSSLRRALESHLSESAWEHRLERLEQWTGAAPSATPGARLYWGVECNPRRPITPFVSRLGKSGKWLKARRVAPDAINWTEVEHDMTDRLLAAELTVDRGRSGTELWSQLERLEGRERLVRAEAPHQPIRLHKYAPTLRVEATNDALVVHIEFEGAPLAVTDVLELSMRSDRSTLAIHRNWVSDLWGTELPDYSLIDLHHDHDGMFLMVPWDEPYIELLRVFGTSGQRYPKSAFERIQRVLERIESMVPVEWSAATPSGPITSLSRAVVTASPSVSRGGITLTVTIQPHPGSGMFLPGDGSRVVPAVVDGRLGLVERDFATENERIYALRDALGKKSFESLGRFNEFELAAKSELLPLIAFAKDSGDYELRWESIRPPALRRLNPVSLRLTGDHNWFDIDGEVPFGEAQLTLRSLLYAARTGERFVRLDASTYAALDEELATELRRIDAAVVEDEERLRVSPEGLLSIQETLRNVGEVHGDDAHARWEAALQDLQGASPMPGTGLRGTLRPYQLDGFQWLNRMGRLGLGCVLADDMGLGKTVQALAYISSRSGPSLVIAPTSVCDNWWRECARFLPAADPRVYRGEARGRHLEALSERSIVITSYSLLQRDADKLAAVDWDLLIFDEAQQLKNPGSKTTRAALTLNACHRIALTGTPLENHLGELWSLFRVLAPGLLGPWERFTERFAKPIAAGVRRARKNLAHLIGPFILRRDKAQVAPELPPRQEILVDIHLDAKSREIYERVRAHAELHLTTNAPESLGIEKKRFQVLASLTRLRQVVCSPALIDDGYEQLSPKLSRALEMMEQLVAEGRRVLVFSQFVSFLDLLREQLDLRGVPYASLDGSTPAPERQSQVDAFQAGKLPLFLLSLKAGGTGINLTAADTVLHLDPWWNPAVEQQATDRAHRLGQKNPVTVYKLVGRRTVEEKILSLQESKRALLDSTLAGATGQTPLSLEDLLALIDSGFESQPPTIERSGP